MKNILIVVFSLISNFSFAQQMTYKEWKEKAKTEIRLLPEYGKVQKTPGQLEADKEFIDDQLK